MPPSRPVRLLPFLVLPLAGCPGGGVDSGFEVVTTGLNPAEVGHGYEAQLAVSEGADGAVTWTVSAGELPEGMALGPDGLLSGDPMRVGTFGFLVLAVDAAGGQAVVALVLEVGWREGEVSLGVDPGEVNNMCLDDDGDNARDLMCGPWVRVADAGNPGQDVRALTPTLVWWGDNEIPEDGQGDDVAVGELEAAEVAWGFEADVGGTYDGEEISPIDAGVDGAGNFLAGDETGPGRVTLAWQDLAGEAYAMVVPPDWCPEEGC